MKEAPPPPPPSPIEVVSTPLVSQPCAGALSPRGLQGSISGLWRLWFGTQDPDVRGVGAESGACAGLQN